MTPKWHACAICFRTQFHCDVLSGQNIRTTPGYVALHFEDASCSILRDFPKRSLCHGEVDDGKGGMNAICSRMEVADDVIAGTVVDTFQCYACVKLCVAGLSSFRENLNQPFMQCIDDGGSSWAPFLGSRQKCLMHHTTKDEAIESPFPKLQTFLKATWTDNQETRREHDPKFTRYRICFRPEVVDDVISDWNAKTIDGKLVANFEVEFPTN